MNAYFYPHGGSSNHGCEAIVRTTKNIVEKTGMKFEFTLCSDNKKQDIDNGITGFNFLEPNKINRYSPYNIAEKFITKVFNKYSYATILRVKNISDNINEESICFSIGGDNYSYKGYIPYNIIRLNDVAKRKNCKIVYWGCSVGEDCLNKHVVADLHKYSLVIARESITYGALIKAGITRNTHLFPDPAFTLDVVRLELPDGFIEGKTIGLNVSPLIQSMELGDNITYKNYQALVQHIIDKTDFQVAFIPHVVWEHNNDLVPLAQLYNEFKHTGRVVLIGDHNCMELKGFISRCRMFIGARTHASIAAYSTCVPTLVVGYSVKAKGIARDIFGTYENYVLPVQSLKSADELTNAFKWLMQNEEGIRHHLQSFMPGYIEKAWQAGEEVKMLIEDVA